MMFVYFFILLALGCQGFASVDNMGSAMIEMIRRDLGTMTSQQKADLRRMWQMPTLRTLSKEEAKKITASCLAVPAGALGANAVTPEKKKAAEEKKKAAEALALACERGAKELGLKFERTVGPTEALNLWRDGKALKGIHWVSLGAFPYKPEHSRMVDVGFYQERNSNTNEALAFKVHTSLVNDPVISPEDLRTLDGMLPLAAPEDFEMTLYGDEADPQMYSRKRPTLRLGWEMIRKQTIGGGLVIVSPARIPYIVLPGNKYNVKRFIYYKGAKAFSVLVILDASVV